MARNIQRLSALNVRAAIGDIRARFHSAIRFALVIGCQFAHRAVGIHLPRFLKRPTDIHRPAEANNQVKPYDGEIVSIFAGTPYNQTRWEDVARGGINLIQLPVVPTVKTDIHLTDATYLADLTKSLNRLIDARNRGSAKHSASNPNPLR